MKITPIESATNPLVKKVRGLALKRSARERSGEFVIDNLKLILEAMQSGFPLKEVIVSKSFLSEGHSQRLDCDQVFVVDDKLFAKLATTESKAGILATARIPEFSFHQVLDRIPPMLAILDGIQDPGNLGSIFRSAFAAGASGIILSKGTVDAFNPKVVRSSAGAILQLPHLSGLPTEESIALSRKAGLHVMAICQTGSKPIWQADLTRPVAFLFGNEGQGIKEPACDLVDSTFSIPMVSGQESLNVSIAAAVTLFQAVQQRHSSPSSC